MPLNTPRNRYIAILATIAALILIVGWRWRPEKPSDSPPSQADLIRLARLSQKSNLEDMATFFSDIARQASVGLLWIEGLERQGVVWNPSGAVISAVAKPQPQVQAAVRGVDEGDIPLQTELYSAPLSFRLLKAPPELALAPLRVLEPRNLRQGKWLVAVNRTGAEHYEFAPGIYAGQRVVTCGGIDVVELLASYGDSAQSIGAAVFSLDGELAGIVFECEREPKLIAASSIAKAVERARAVDSQLQFRYGFRPAELNDASKAYFKIDQGLLVMEVWMDTLAWQLGLRPGDLITSLDTEPVHRLDDLAVMTVPMYRPEYTLGIRRGRTARKIVFPPGAGLGDDSAKPAARAVIIDGAPTGIPIRSVEPGTAAARAGLRAGDRLLSVGPQYNPARPDASALGDDGQDPLFVVVSREDEVLGLFLNEGVPE